MTNKEIERCNQRVTDIQKKPAESETLNSVKELAKEIGAPVPPTLAGEPAKTRTLIDESLRNIRFVLQTEMMLNACVFAKRSCFYAAIAAIAACISVLLVLFYA